VPVDDLLRAVADRYGVAVEYWDQSGEHHVVDESTIVAVLRALGVSASSAEERRAALKQAELRDWRRMLPPVFVTRQDEARRLGVHVPHGDPVRAWIECEDGSRLDLVQQEWWVDPVEIDGQLIGEASFTIPADLPLGWHTIHARGSSDGGDEATCPLAVTPVRLDFETVTGDRQWGFMVQAYAMRSHASWGLGDLSDCRTLGSWSATDLGAGFLLVNPMHAAEMQKPLTPSPYLPSSRRFAHPIYLDVTRIKDFERLSDKQRRAIKRRARRLRRLNTATDLLNRDRVWAEKRRALQAIFRAGRGRKRAAQFAAYCAEQGKGLIDFATWCALSDRFGNDWTRWPRRFAHPGSPAVRKFRAKHAKSIAFFCWLQWITDEQLADLQQTLRDAGMPIGMIHDLAVGVHPEGADAWALQDVLAAGVTVGAPPDMYNQMGQNWSQPPWRPDALADAAFLPYRDMLRTVFRNAGGLRVDHILGLFRMWWIPRGMPASAGTFVRFDHEAMLGILCLEAHRAGAMVIGEDLGTVAPSVREELADRGILGTSVLWFESTSEGQPRPLDDWARDVLASVTVHDLPPTAGYLRDEHVRLRHELGLLATSLPDALQQASEQREAWVALLRQGGYLSADVDVTSEVGLEEFVRALYRALAATPARLIGVAVPDVVGDRRAQNQPGTDTEYPNWRFPITTADGQPLCVDDLVAASTEPPIVTAVRGTLVP
jgi:4-alpha-glucanotransferase